MEFFQHQGFRDDLIAQLVTGNRVLSTQNLESHRPSWNNTTIATLATDGTLKARAKYGAETTGFHGILPILTHVYGALSFHHDLTSRAYRVELRGPARHLSHHPQEYARAHRAEILAEAREAHRQAALTIGSFPPITRAHTFERVALPAAAVALGLPFAEAHELLEKMCRQRAALEHVPMAALANFNLHPGKIWSESLTHVFANGKLDSKFEGLEAMGLTVRNGKWENNS